MISSSDKMALLRQLKEETTGTKAWAFMSMVDFLMTRADSQKLLVGGARKRKYAETLADVCEWAEEVRGFRQVQMLRGCVPCLGLIRDEENNDNVLGNSRGTGDGV